VIKIIVRFELVYTVREFGTAEQPGPKERSREAVYKYPAGEKWVSDISRL
jgi:hypothetical protein